LSKTMAQCENDEDFTSAFIPAVMPATARTRFATVLTVAALLLVGGGFAAAYTLPRTVWEAVGIASPKKVSSDDDLPPCCRARGVAAKEAATEFVVANVGEAHRKLVSPSIAAADDGRVFVAWAAPTNEEKWNVFLATSLDGGKIFDPPRPVMKVPALTSPGVAIDGDKVDLRWVEGSGENSPLRWLQAESTNGGLTFGEAADFVSAESYIKTDGGVVDTQGQEHRVFEQNIPAADGEESSGRMIMYAKTSQAGESTEPKGIRPRNGAVQSNSALALVKDVAIVAFCEVDAKGGTKIVVSRVE
jgi:hypothetical protein